MNSIEPLLSASTGSQLDTTDASAEWREKTAVILLDYSPELPIGYTVNLLKAAALAVPEINRRYDIRCQMISAKEYPFEQAQSAHTRKDNALLCELMSNDPAVIGLSVFVWNINFFSRFTRLIKLMNPNCKVIWGGKLVTSFIDRLAVENPDVDCFCIGEGELVFRNYLLHLLTNEEAREPLAGTVMKINGRYVHSPLVAPLTRLDEMPNPYIEGLIDSNAVGMASIETLRGCLFHCTFCDWGKDYRKFSDDYVCNVTKAVLAQRFEVIFYMDSVFAMDTARRKKFLRTVLDNYNDYSEFGFEVMLEMLDDETSEMFRELASRKGIAKIQIGVQSINPETLKVTKRPLNRQRFVEKYNKLIKDSPALQEQIQIDLIIGLPKETVATFGRGLNFVFSLDPGKISAFPLEVFPGSEMYSDQMQQYSIVALDRPPFSIVSSADMNANQIQELTVLSWVATSLRSFMRRSLFYLHHMTRENIFTFFQNFRDWCIAHSYTGLWHQFGRLEDHAVRIVEYVTSESFADGTAAELANLKQLLLFDLAPLMMIHGKQRELESLWRRPGKGELGRLRDRTKAESGSATKRALFWFDHLVRHECHCESTSAALGVAGSPVGLMVEVQGGNYRATILSTREFRSALKSFASKDVYIARDVARGRAPKAIKKVFLRGSTVKPMSGESLPRLAS
ncbi:MAG: B12-binding domain-containing radical SAM protein [Candidatus Korobacteraceae bacterium]